MNNQKVAIFCPKCKRFMGNIDPLIKLKEKIIFNLECAKCGRIGNITINPKSILEEEREAERIKLKLNGDKKEKHLRFFKNAPEWNVYYPNLSDTTQEQRAFYDFWLDSFNKGNFVDIQGNLSYIFVFLDSVLEEFIRNENIDTLLNSFEKIRDGYSQYSKFNQYLISWEFDAYLYLGNYDKAWDIGRKRKLQFSMDDVINFRSKCKDTSINGQDLLCMAPHHLFSITKFGEEYQEQIISLATIYFKDFHKKHGENFIEYYYNKFNFSNLTKDNFLQLIKEFYPDMKHSFVWEKRYEKEKTKNYHDTYTFTRHLLIDDNSPSIRCEELLDNTFSFLIDVASNLTDTLKQPSIECKEIPNIVNNLLSNKLNKMLRGWENEVREANNFPKVGEGWISETALYYKIKNWFKNYRTIHHAHPLWLGQQHLDIFIPELKLAIEYQGAQHFRPIEFFGGEKAFRMVQENDKRKKELCNKNGINLIYVVEDDVEDKIFSKLNLYLKKC